MRRAHDLLPRPTLSALWLRGSLPLAAPAMTAVVASSRKSEIRPCGPMVSMNCFPHTHWSHLTLPGLSVPQHTTLLELQIPRLKMVQPNPHET